MYGVIFDTAVIDFLSKLSQDLRERIYNKIASTKENPHRYFERLTGRKDYKLRVGDYRVIADINNSTKRIEVTLIDHRSRVYKNI